MTAIGSDLPTLVDVAKSLDPDGKPARIAERLSLTNEVLEDIPWFASNKTASEQTTVRAGLPSVYFRSLNAGVPRSKSVLGQIEDTVASIAGYAECDKKEADISGDAAAWRLKESKGFFEAMSQAMATYMFYGNTASDPKQFNGLATRYNTLAGTYGGQVIDAGGTGVDNVSIWLVVWGEDTVKGIYPKGTQAGLQHNDMSGPNGIMIEDAAGNKFPGYQDWYEWDCGLAVKDPRYAVRIANIDRSLLTASISTGANIQMLMVDALERVQSLTMPGTKPAFYVPREISAMLRKQILTTKNGFLSLDEIAGRKVTYFDNVPVRRVDALAVNEARVV